MTEPAFVMRRLLNELTAYTYRMATEWQLQDGIEQVLTELGIEFRREHIEGNDRFDFLVEGCIVIEVKVGGSLSAALRQVHRYCEHEDVAGVVIATSTHWQLHPGTVEFSGKPVELAHCRSRAF